jgi:hypothetical protein
MLTPAPQRPDDRGPRWLQAQVLHILADNSVALATPRIPGDPVCYWGTEPATAATLYVLLAGDPEPKALPFSPSLIAQCGTGLYAAQHNALMRIRRTLKQQGILPA